MGKESHSRKKTPIRKVFRFKGTYTLVRNRDNTEELAEKADLHPTYIGSVERSERNITLENIIALAKSTGMFAKRLDARLTSSSLFFQVRRQALQFPVFGSCRFSLRIFVIVFFLYLFLPRNERLKNILARYPTTLKSKGFRG